MNYNLSQTEQEIMNLFWQKKQWLTGADLWTHFNSHGKSMKRQTTNTYLTRMTEKGLLVKNGVKYMYAYTKEEFESGKAKEVLDTMYDGSLKKFIVALSGTQTLSVDDAEDLINYLDEID